MKSTDIPENKCLDCGYPFEMASDVFGGRKKPHAGDISICLKCGHLMAFDHDLTVRPLTDAEMYEVAGDKRIIAIQKARDHVLKDKRK